MMSSQISATNPGIVLAWDTEFFGIRIGRALGDRLDSDGAAVLDRWARQESIECLYFLGRSDCPQTIIAAEVGGYHLTDVRVELSRRLPEPSGNRLPLGVFIREAEAADRTPLSDMARHMFRKSRYYHDGRFALDQCDALFATWITNSLDGYADNVFVVESEGHAVGFVTCTIDRDKMRGSIGLVGVRACDVGRGFGSVLVRHCLQWFSEMGMSSVVVVTQGCNVAAQRVYQRCGFLTQSVKYWYHKWYSP